MSNDQKYILTVDDLPKHTCSLTPGLPLKDLPAVDKDLPSRKDRLDVSKIFLSYLACGGDIPKCADMADCTIGDVVYLARSEMWDKKLSESALVRGSGDGAKDKAREMNRMACYVQAIRLRGLIDKTLQRIYEDPDFIEAYCSEKNKQGKSVFSTKPVLDLVKAAEGVHAMTYRALGDKITEAEGGVGATVSLRDLHLTLINANQNMPPDELLKQAEKATPAAEVKRTLEIDVEEAMKSDDDTGI